MADAHSIISQTLLEDFATKRTFVHNSLSEVKIKLDATLTKLNELDQRWIEFEDLYFQIFSFRKTEK